MSLIIRVTRDVIVYCESPFTGVNYTGTRKYRRQILPMRLAALILLNFIQAYMG